MNWLMNRRREMMQENGAGYIMDGLVFWMDGINKGETKGVWTDLIGGIVFTPDDDSVIFNNNNVYCPASKGLYYNGRIYAPFSTYTIEGAYNSYLNGDSVFELGYKSGNQNLALGSYGSLLVCSSGGGINTFRVDNYNIITKRLISVNSKVGMYNFTTRTLIYDNDSTWSQVDGVSTIGRGQGNGTYGYNPQRKNIYSLRIYNRQLSTEEMLYNQQIDNIRFNLGL